MNFKRINILLLSSAIFTLSACTFFDDTSVGTSRQEYLGWYCEVDINLSDQWHCSERLLSDALPIDKVPQPAAKIQAAEISLSEPAPQENVEQQSELNLYTNFDISADAYTVQLGAYLSQAMAEQSAARITTDGGQLTVHNIIVGGQYRFVIIYGQYPTHQQAKVVAEQLMTLNPQLDYWVRSIKSLRNSL